MDQQEKRCKTCGHCKYINSETSPGGMMFITNYKCDNPESPHRGHEMNSIMSQGKIMDARDGQGCDFWEDRSTVVLKSVSKEAKEVATKVKDVIVDKAAKAKESVDEYLSGLIPVDENTTVVSSKSKGQTLIAYFNPNRKTIITLNGVELDVPEHVLNASPKCIINSSGRIYINGYRYVDGTFRRNLLTLTACKIS